MYEGFHPEHLDETHLLFHGRLPEPLLPDAGRFNDLWKLHPSEFHEIMMHGKLVKTPRWQQAYGKDYHYTQSTNRGLPTPPSLQPFLEWSHSAIDSRLNGILVNWYDGALGHYIGRHRDSTANMVDGAPIVTISLGQERVFRLRPWKGEGCRDFAAADGTVFIMPYDTNLAWTHEITRRARDQGQRISITLRAFL